MCVTLCVSMYFVTLCHNDYTHKFQEYPRKHYDGELPVVSTTVTTWFEEQYFARHITSYFSVNLSSMGCPEFHHYAKEVATSGKLITFIIILQSFVLSLSRQVAFLCRLSKILYL